MVQYSWLLQSTDQTCFLLRLKNALTCLFAVQAKSAALQTAHHDGQARVNQQIQQLQGEKKNVTRRMEGFGSQLQQGLLCKLLE